MKEGQVSVSWMLVYLVLATLVFEGRNGNTDSLSSIYKHHCKMQREQAVKPCYKSKHIHGNGHWKASAYHLHHVGKMLVLFFALFLIPLQPTGGTRRFCDEPPVSTAYRTDRNQRHNYQPAHELSQKGFQETSEFKSSWKSLFSNLLTGWESFVNVSIVTLPSSMDLYLNDKLKNKKPTSELMHHEWARLESFKDFPASSPGMPTKLAQAGFYFTGKEDEVACFSCGMKHKGWQHGMSALQVHSNKAPYCEFVNHRDLTNVSIHGQGYAGDVNHNISPNGIAESATAHACSQMGGASGGPGDLSVQSTQVNESETQSRHVIARTEYNQNPTKNDEIKSREKRENENRPSHTRTGQAERQLDDRQMIHSRRRNERPPKHPEHSSVAVRRSTYTGWPCQDIADPQELVIAGFYYAGFGDCVRCFHCGGGLRNWDYGDSPWQEHARWYPDCPYLRQCKGDAYVEEQLALMRAERGLPASRGSATNQTANSETPVSPPAIDPLEGDAALTLAAMGYSRDAIQSVIDKFQRSRGHSDFTASDLMELILEAEDKTSRGTPPRPEQSNQKSGSKKPDVTTNSVSSVVSATTRPTSLSAEQKSLLDENQELKDQMTCKICMENEANIVFLPCGHLVACVQCASAVRKCVICRKVIKGTVKTYIT